MNNCGSSSRLVRRNTRPTAVTLGSFRILKSGPAPSFWLISPASIWSAPTAMDRNLIMRNGREFTPTRSAQ
ncbi:Uncharacterised protein [Mycobacteroides abscessus subsp. abscessus]|nr:Uncharacterised protein [Mycobacteroides abscessus subsp. abscessus]